MNGKAYGRKWSWPELRYYPCTYVEGMIKITTDYQYSQPVGRD
jgi:hypothetical protein